MSFRRFVYLVASDCAKANYTLRRIDMSRFFLPTTSKDGCGWSLLGQDPPPVEEDCRLPVATMDFYPPHPHGMASHGEMGFMLLGNKVVATNEKRQAMMYDPDIPAIHYLPSITKFRCFPISIAVGNNLYVLDGSTINGNYQSFDALVFNPLIKQEHGWEWRSLPPVPPLPSISKGKKTWINSLATVRGSNHSQDDGTHIWVSVKTDDDGAANGCTCSFDTERLMWSKPVDWSLPFCGVAEYVPLHNFWFGISSSDHGSVFCASKLTAAAGEGPSFSLEACRSPPVLLEVFDDMAGSPKEWRLGTSHAVHLGSGKFCIVRFFERYTPNVQPFLLLDYCVVFAGVEVLNCNGKLQMVKHRSERYMFRDEEFHIVL